jgi:hypothetical protein
MSLIFRGRTIRLNSPIWQLGNKERTMMPLAYIRFIEMPELPERPGWGGPVDPGWGLESGRPGQLPGRPAFPERPSHGLPFPGFPERPGHLPSRPGRPVDPGYGVDEGGLEIWPLPPEGGGLPPVPGQPLPPTDPPPGTVWPPLPPSIPEGKALAVIWISGVGSRYAVITVPPHPEHPDRPPTERPERPPRPQPKA